MSDNLEHPFVGAYWASRKETREECAKRIFQFLSSIHEIQIFSDWYFLSNSRRKANKPLELSLEGISKKLKVQRTDVGREIMEDLGFSLSVWNGNDEQSASFSSTIGGYSQFVGNNAVLRLPIQVAPSTSEEKSFLEGLMKKTVKVFDPDEAVVTSTEFLMRINAEDPLDGGGWLVYRKPKGRIGLPWIGGGR